MLDRGILSAAGFYPSLAHTADHIDQYLHAAEEVFAELGQAVRQGDAAARLQTPVRHAGFARLT